MSLVVAFESIDIRRLVREELPSIYRCIEEGIDMPGASPQTRHIKTVNANWTAGPDGRGGKFGMLFITDDDVRHAVAPDADAMVALISLVSQHQVVLMWDPADQTLIAANLVGKMPWTEQFLGTTLG